MQKTLPQCDPRIHCIRQQFTRLQKRRTSQRADANTQPQSDIQMRCICSKSSVLRLNSAIQKDSATVWRPYMLHLSVTCTCSRKTYSATRRVPERHPAQLADANTQPQGDLHLRCICSHSHIFHTDTQRPPPMQMTRPLCDPRIRCLRSNSIVIHQDIQRNALVQTLSRRSASAYAASAATQAPPKGAHSATHQCKHSTTR